VSKKQENRIVELEAALEARELKEEILVNARMAELTLSLRLAEEELRKKSAELDSLNTSVCQRGKRACTGNSTEGMI
jgi:hypothetical protein